MLSDGLPPTDVYQHCGFGDYSNFYRAFKAEYGISPKDFSGTAQTDVYKRQAAPGRRFALTIPPEGSIEKDRPVLTGRSLL